ncbi:hypothetical protein EST38_g8341 [Candolleomyces aberdarensis]|uniref:Uncharacterized protein n=1 Tax=Candolleomyces aberdarensis TaxID=2316362 RepID=A0A4Q2DG75_9AGAR|nr:hypothetical protein EST38_g8341 [Candolleomyces aberdarensis]
MNEESRAKDLFVPGSRIYTHLAKCCLQRIIESPELHSLPDKQEDMSASEKCPRTAIAELDYLLCAAAIDDEIVEFTHKGGWHKIDMVLSKPSGYSIIFSNDWARASQWICGLCYIADRLKKRRPEAAAIMSKYLKKWEPSIDEMYPRGSRFRCRLN